MSLQQLLPMGAEIDRLIKLGEAQRLLKEVFYPTPDRKTIIGWLDEGLLEGRTIGSGNNHYIYQSSLQKLINKYQRKIAA